MAQIIPFPADAEDMMSKAYERWGERHEALEDELDELLDLLDGQ